MILLRSIDVTVTIMLLLCSDDGDRDDGETVPPKKSNFSPFVSNLLDFTIRSERAEVFFLLGNAPIILA